MSGRRSGLASIDPKVLEVVRPTTLSKEQLLEVPVVLEPLFPWGGLQRGWSVGITGNGSWALTSALLAPSLGEEGWLAVVGAPLVNLAAGAEVGLRMDRVLVVETPPAGQWGTVITSLLEAVQAVVIAPPTRIGDRDARRIAARLREQRGVLVHLDGGTTWPNALDSDLVCTTDEWQGIGEGHGYLRYRRLTIEASGRRSAAKRRSVSVWMPGPDGPLTAAENLASVSHLPVKIAASQ
ncbi:MAG: hypothetical protein HKN24_10680 [Acidimicrobiales bacterium]|nr:hypothetical protein [Acidimicrobiales bacterium]